MANPIVKINGKHIQRTQIVKWWLSDGTYVNVMDVTGETESKAFDTASGAEAALAVLDNLTEIDDIDGL